LDGQGGASYTDISRFIESAKPPLIRLELHFSGLPESDTDPASVVFESLLHYGKDVEVLHFSTAYGLSRADLRVLAHPECLPHLRELSIGRFDYERTDMQRVAKAHPCEKMIVAVLHKTTLESISLEGEDLLLGSAFVQACVELPQLHSIDRVDFAAETSLTLLECLFHKHDWLGTDLVQTAILRLSMRRVCAACLSVNGDIVRTHRIYECPEAASINFQEAETKQWPEGKEHGYCSQCFIPIYMHSRLEDGGSGKCNWKATMEPLISFFAALDPAWKELTESGEPGYWRPILRILCRVRRGDWFWHLG
jgi:hypothetical protein